tara:strand:+ start:1285 stop:2106 length:822 start_codon:yes stop_codon:yes gene_type:complete
MNKENFRIITCTNEKDLYIRFWPSMAQNWTKWYGIEKITCAVITDRDENDPVIQEMKKYGEIILIKPLKNIVTDDIQSKATRLFLATQYPDDYCIIADIDMYILNKTETWAKWFSHVEENKLLCISRNAPYSGTDIGKFPMAFTTATGSVWKEIVNPNNLTYIELFKSWYDMNEHDSMEKVNQPFHQFSDESLLRGLISKWENYGGKYGYDHPRCIGIEREDWSGERAIRRIDRLYWNIDKALLESGGYYDSQPVRPYNSHALKPILEYLNIK